MFIGRQRELDELEKKYHTSGFQMFVLYGRRRVGKTRLIQEFCKNKKTIFHVGIQQTSDMQLESFSRDILKQLPSKGSEFIRKFQSWQDAFSYIAQKASEQRVILVIDEYPYIAQSDPSVSSVLQKIIDHELKNTELFLILCGSSMSFMENQVLGYQSPLYGRRTAQMKIQPLPYWESIDFFDHWQWQDKLYAFGVCGGIPQYLEYFSYHRDFPSAVKAELLSLSGHLAEEPTNLMQQEMREPSIYNSIIDAIARGKTKQNEIANTVGKDSKDITSYLRALLDLGIIAKKQPIEENNRKKVIYSIADNLYRFWHRFMPACLSLISMNMEDTAWKEVILPELDTYFGQVFESICLQYTQREIQKAQRKHGQQYPRLTKRTGRFDPSRQNHKVYTFLKDRLL
jgi:AAA+ ATPase superfamily predicted ATPase